MISTLSSKGQITLPKDLRDRLKLQSGDKIEFLLQADGRVELLPVTASVKRLQGCVPKPKRTLTLEDMDAAIHSRAAKR